MKKIVVLILGLMMLVSCKKEEVKKVEKDIKESSLKLGWVDTKVLMDSCIEAKDLNDKLEQIIKTKGASLDAEKRKFQNEIMEAEKSAQTMGPQWAQAKMQEFQQKEQRLAQNEQKVSRDIQEQGAKELDVLIKKIKGVISDYAKNNKYDYIYGTGETTSILYGKEENDLTAMLIEMINKEYKNSKDKK